MTGATILDIRGGPQAVRAVLPDPGDKGRDRVRCPACGGPATATAARDHRGKTLLTCWSGCERAAIVTAAHDVLPVGDGERPKGDSSGAGRRRPPAQPPARKAREAAPKPAPAIAVRLWAATAPADPTPSRVCLARRLAWPPRGIGPDLPAAVAWLPADAAPPRCKGWPGLPDGAAGAVAFRFGDPVRFNEAAPAALAVSLEALSVDGNRLAPRWRRTIGPRAGALFDAGGQGPAIILAEGEVSALACRWLHPGARCFATGGASALAAIRASMLPGGPVAIEADGDKPGRDAARAAMRTLLGAAVTWRRGGDGDPADELAATVGERLAIAAIDGGLSDAESLAQAWRDMSAEYGTVTPSGRA